MSVQDTALLQLCKNDNFQMKFFDIFAQNIDCGYMLEPPQRGGSNEYPQSMFWSKNKKYVYPSKPHIFYMSLSMRKGTSWSKYSKFVFSQKRKETIIKSSFRCFYCQLLHETIK